MAVFFWYLGKSDLSSVSVYSSVHWKRQFLQGARNTRPCVTGKSVIPEFPKNPTAISKFPLYYIGIDYINIFNTDPPNIYSWQINRTLARYVDG